MKHRTIAIAALCVAALITAGCSSKFPGTPETGDSAPVGTQETADSAAQTEESADNSSDTGGATDESSDFSVGDLTSAQSELSDLGGLLNNECLAVAGLSMTVGLLLAAPLMGGTALTADDVSKAFEGLDQVPPELADAMKVLHEAAVEATGKSMADAATILGSDKVSAAFDKLSAYMTEHCDGG